jgi:hypothetical protein
MNDSIPPSSVRERRRAWNKGNMPGSKASLARSRLGDTHEVAETVRHCNAAIFPFRRLFDDRVGERSPCSGDQGLDV